ncbi:MAG: FAD-dependent oxidoreductase [Christensenellaceae bacterium]|jgi:NADPH-dependent 2,4-dienoyl-CoA reductase/sulfur reductase-like enzyme|nr:FAD-dependent oxidoreductase [Christensenellaceae bacterium]
MTQTDKDVIIIGGGPAGLAAAVKLHELGVRDILILEREHALGGILRQCIHDGFGLTRFSQTLTGPEYAQRFIDAAAEQGIAYMLDTTVLRMSAAHAVTAASRKGLHRFNARAIILAMGCRERTRGALSIPGARPTGIYTAGVAQSYINLQNTMVGKNAVILGSGDIGMIMARRLTLEGARVSAVFELQPYPSGLPRNVEQCLYDYDIPLYLRHTVTNILGDARLQAVEVSEVGEDLRPLPGTQRLYPCDTLILSVGLIPENELALDAGVLLDAHTGGAVVDESYQTTVPGIFAAGNVLHVHDLVDFVSLEAERMAEAVKRYLAGEQAKPAIAVSAGRDVAYALPQHISGARDALLTFRPRRPLRDATLRVLQDGQAILTKRFPRMLPAQMEQALLPAAALKSHNPVEVVIGDA